MASTYILRRYLLVTLIVLLMIPVVVSGVRAEGQGNESGQQDQTAAGKAGDGEQQDGQASEPVKETGTSAATHQDENYITVKENSLLRLGINSEGKVTITDKRNNHTWRSNPDAKALASETVKGHWRRNLESPFYLEYTNLKLGETKLKYGNYKELKAKASVKQTAAGAEITYDLLQIKSSITFIVTLKDDYFEVQIPSDRIKEGADIHIINLWAFPFMGASRSDVEGHMFVPDNMGATIDFEQNGSYPFRYSAEIYGSDLALSVQSLTRFRDRQSEALLPVFGISYGQNALFGVITEGEANATINATPGGMLTSYNWIAPQFKYREQYFRRTSSFGQGFNVFEKKLLKQDRGIRYYFLQGEKPEAINYVGMAAAYRSYLMETKGLKRLQPPDHLQLDLSFFGGDREPSMFGSKLIKTTTFDQAREAVNKFRSAGIARLDLTFMGWSKGGYMRYLPQRLPPEKGLGGEEGLSRLIEDIHRGGNRIFLDDNYTTAYSGNGFIGRVSAVRDSNTRVVEDQINSTGFSFRKAIHRYWMQPDLSESYLEKSLPEYKNLAIDGLSQDGIGGKLYSDNNPSNPFSREKTASVFQTLLSRTKEELGQVRVTHGNAYVLGYTDHISQLPLSTSYDLLARQSVPFYPIAIHGLVTYSGQPGNLRDENTHEFLKSVEYGALPAYLLTYEDSSSLKDTYTSYIYSGTYSEWINTIVEEYQRMDAAMGGLQDRFIVNHRELTEDVFETIYDNGQRIVVNYGDSVYLADGVKVAPKDFALVGKGE